MVNWKVTSICARWHIDIISGLPKTPEGYRYILLCVESLSRWPEAFPLKTQSAVEVADCLFNQVFTRYGCPEVLMSDRGTNFMSKVVTRLCNLFHTRRTVSSGFRPQSNSAVENLNRTIWSCLRAYCEKQEKWNDYLQTILLGFRSTISASSTQYTPYHIMFGREIRLPIDNQLLTQSFEGSATADEYVKEPTRKIRVMHEVARACIEDSQEKYKVL